MDSTSIPEASADLRPLPFPDTSKQVWRAVKELNAASFKRAMKVSPKLLPEVQSIWNRPWSHFSSPKAPLAGATAYVGEAFKWLDLQSLSPEGQGRARDQVHVLSALYGLVQPDTAIAPYRLEMQAPLAEAPFGTLYQLWRPVLTERLNQLEAPFLVNAMSGEYSKAVDWDRIHTPVLHVDFKQEKNGEIKSMSVFSKQARGAFVRWMVEESVGSIDHAMKFDLHNYRFYEQKDNKVVFLRHA